MLWDPVTAAPLEQLKGHTSQVAALAVLQDGTIVSGSMDK
jgi:hypothetical protein